ncbi:MAG: hypothetical protein IK107_01975 [Oscillospiraceae bacterium]|nr:hypothetical protein [Oscillospiraceae bacterium]
MEKIFLGIRVIFGSMLLWVCGIGMLILMILLCDSLPQLHLMYSGREIPINIGMGAAIFALLIWRFTAWRKKLGNDISTGVFVLLVILGGVLPLAYIWCYLHSFD